MTTIQPEIINSNTPQRRTSRWAGRMVLGGWFLLVISINTLSIASVRIAATELLILRLIFPCSAVILLTYGLLRGGRATRILAILGLGFAAFIYFCIFT